MVKKRAKKRPVKKVVKKAMKVLPMKLSALIKIALADIRKAEKEANKYIIEMGTWYEPNREVVCRLEDDGDGDVISREKVCVMCAAGSVMRFSLNAGDNSDIEDPHAMGEINVNQLYAIDYLRQGCVIGAARQINVIDYETDTEDFMTLEKIANRTNIPIYERGNTEPFHKALGKLRDTLIKHGF